MTAFPAHPKFGVPRDGDQAAQLPCIANNEHDWYWHNNPQSTPTTYRMCPHCHAIDASEAIADNRPLLGYVVVAKNAELGRIRPMGIAHPDPTDAKLWRDSLFGPLGLSQPTYVIAEVRELLDGSTDA